LTPFLPLAYGRFQRDSFAVAEIPAHRIRHFRAGASKRAEAAIRNVSRITSRKSGLDQDAGSYCPLGRLQISSTPLAA
jgi:hypothetical protein